MPSTRKKKTKDGREYYEIRVSRGRGQSYLTTRWYVPEGWGQKAIDKELTKEAADFERKVKAGEVVSRAEAKQKAEQEREEAAKAAAEEARLPTLERFATEKFMPKIAVDCAENTRASYQTNLDTWIIPAVGGLKMKDITPADLQGILDGMKAQGKAHGTVLKVHVVLSSLFRTAKKAKVILNNPMADVDRPAPRPDEVIKNEAALALTAEELSYVLDCIGKAPLKWQAFIALAADTGARRGELCGLLWKDVDWKSGMVKFEGNLQYSKEKGVYRTIPKTKKIREVDLGPDTLTILRAWRTEQSEKCISQYVFTKENSPEPMFPQSPTRYFKRFGERYGILSFHPHVLRHTSASLALTSGAADIKSIADRLGHSEAVLLKKYAHSTDESRRRAGQAVRDAVKKQA